MTLDLSPLLKPLAAPISGFLESSDERLLSLDALADKGHDLRLIQDYLGHRDPRHTVHYTRTAGRRFEGLWGR